MKKALIVEDDELLADLVEIHLIDLQFEVEKVREAKAGLDKALHGSYDLIVLDLMLPDGNGLDVCRQLRQEKLAVPIIMLTARSEEIDKVLGLETGADDYITKPFSVREFSARVKAVLRRSNTQQEVGKTKSTLVFGQLKIDAIKKEVKISDKRAELTPKEFELLLLLASHPGRSYSREELLDIIWGYQYQGYEHTVNSHINRLRAKIESDASSPEFILTSWGIGYRFNDNW